MTSQKDQIQTLISEIEASLANPLPSLPLGLSSTAEQQRQLLHKLSAYLRSLEQLLDAPGGWGPVDPSTGNLVPAAAEASPQTADSAAQVLQGLLLEMQHLRENALKPMRTEVEALRQQRESLQAEINVLEAQQSVPASELEVEATINRFLETLMQRLQGQLTDKLAQTLATVEPEPPKSPSESKKVIPLLPGERLEQVRLLQAQSDRLILELDSSITGVFDSLQQSINSYRSSLADGLDEMHGLGRQGEIIFRGFINHLAQQLSQDTSTQLIQALGESPTQAGQLPQTPEATPETPDSETSASYSDLELALENLSLEGETDSESADAADLQIDPDLTLADLDLLEAPPADAADDRSELSASLDPEQPEPVAADNEPTAEAEEELESDGLQSLDEELSLLSLEEEPADAADDFSQANVAQLVTNDELFTIDFEAATSLETDSPGVWEDQAEPAPVESADAALAVDQPDRSDTEDSAELPAETEDTADSRPGESVSDADEIADSLLFDSAVSLEMAAHTEDAIAPSDQSFTATTLFTPDQQESDSTIAVPEQSIIKSLSELLPEPLIPEEAAPQAEDSYDIAPEDEDLVKLSEPVFDQELLTNLDTSELSEQLDADLQQLSGEPFVLSYDLDTNEELAAIDQATLESIADELNLEAVDLEIADEDLAIHLTGTGSLPPDVNVERSTEAESSRDLDAAAEADSDNFDESRDEEADDLFEGFTPPSVSVDAPSLGSERDSEAGQNQGREAGNFDDLAVDDQEGLLDSFDDGLTDSLEIEMAELNEQFQLVSVEGLEDEQHRTSDLEEPVVSTSEAPDIPAVDASDEGLESSLLPDVPTEEEEWDSAETAEAIAADIDNFLQTEFLQDERQAFWQTIEGDEPENGSAPDEIEAWNGSGSEVSDSSQLVTPDDLKLGDLEDLFGQTELPDPDRIEDSGATADTEPAVNLDSVPELESRTEQSDSGMSTQSRMDVGPESLLSGSSQLFQEEFDRLPPADAPAQRLDSSSGTGLADVDETTSAATQEWFLGIDIGATGLSAVLLDRQTGQVYPLSYVLDQSSDSCFRWPVAVQVIPAGRTLAVGQAALDSMTDGQEMTLSRLKSMLKVAVPYGNTFSQSGPWLHWSAGNNLPMLQIQQSMFELLQHLVSQGQAAGLEPRELNHALGHLQGVIVGYPTNWPDTYSFNIREAVLATGLVSQPGQILFIEDAIATLLSGLPDPTMVELADTVSLSRQPSLYNCAWQGATVTLTGGAVMTEMGLVELPQDLSQLCYEDFGLRGFAYGGDAIDQDIVCQLLLPEGRRRTVSAAEIEDSAWDWQGHLTAAEADWSALPVEDLPQPAIGQVDWEQRHQLRQQLLASSLGQSLLAAARYLKVALQEQSQLQMTLGGQAWIVKRRHLENQIFLPYIQRINHYLNSLLSQQGTDPQRVEQVICTGGSASLPSIARWLRQKFPNATIIQDTYDSELPQSCSRVAYGLVNLARYAQVLDLTRHQYSDYFLLAELLRVFPQQPQAVGALMHLLEERGINTQACQQHILALLEGHLPPGLVPTAADRSLICDRTADLLTYQTLLQTPLFTKTATESGGQIYIPNEEQAQRLRNYLAQVLVHKNQTLEEPLLSQLMAVPSSIG